MKEGDLELLIQIARFEESHDMEKEFKIGWSWRHVRIWPSTLSRLFKDGYLENVFRSNSYTGYRLSELGRELVSSKEKEDTADPDAAKMNASLEPQFPLCINSPSAIELSLVVCARRAFPWNYTICNIIPSER